MNIKKLFQHPVPVVMFWVFSSPFYAVDIYDSSEFVDLNSSQDVEVITDIAVKKEIKPEIDSSKVKEDSPIISEDDLGETALSNNSSKTPNKSPKVGNFNLKNLSVQQRITRLENIAEATNFYQQEKLIQELRNEIQTLNGKVEEQEHLISQYQKQHELQNKDINRRLDNIIAAVKNNKGLDLASSKTTTSGDVEKDFYTKGYDYLKAKQYNKAVFQLQTYISKYPDGKYIANANYWLGEVFLLQSNLSGAMEAFSNIITKYPKSDKYKEALLKKGIVYIYQQNLKDAKKTFESIKKQYPNTVVARLADSRLQQIKEQFE